jgi:hypothetical protein
MTSLGSVISRKFWNMIVKVKLSPSPKEAKHPLNQVGPNLLAAVSYFFFWSYHSVNKVPPGFIETILAHFITF